MNPMQHTHHAESLYRPVASAAQGSASSHRQRPPQPGAADGLRRFRLHPLTLATLAWLTPVMTGWVHAETELAPVSVEDEAEVIPAAAGQVEWNAAAVRAPAGDAATALRDLNGVSASRMSQHGLDPIIRGQGSTQLNVTLDGGFVHGGCPNRMDPPASFGSLEGYDRVIVEKGVQTLTDGPGGSGGSIRFERETDRLAAQPGILGKASLGGSDNGLDHAANAEVLWSNGHVYGRLIGESRAGSDYDDGAGRSTPGDFAADSGTAIFGIGADGPPPTTTAMASICAIGIAVTPSPRSPSALRCSFIATR